MSDWEDKKFGRICGADVSLCIKGFRDIWQAREHWQQVRADDQKWCEALKKLMVVPNWTGFYQDSLLTLLAKISVVAGFGPKLSEAACADRPAAFLLETAESLSDEVPDHPAALPLAFAMIGNLDAIACYSRSINDMVEQAKNGDVDSLFAALSVDSAISTMPFFQAALRLGQLSGDASFADGVFASIKGPHKKRYEYPELRWVEYLLRDQGAFEACTRDEIYQLVVEHLRLYDKAGTKEDAKASLFKLFRTWQKQAGIQNPRFGFSASSR